MSANLSIHGEGFALREVEASDAHALAAIEFDPVVKRYLALPSTPKDEWLRKFDPELIGGLAIVTTSDGHFAGLASLDRASRKFDRKIRIVLGNQYQKIGLGTRVTKALLAFAFEKPFIRAIVAHVHPKNEGSLRLLRALHFRRRGVLAIGVPEWQVGHLVYRLTIATLYVFIRGLEQWQTKNSQN
jgi:RimJ/RimL family protein N-acetyltransferase